MGRYVYTLGHNVYTHEDNMYIHFRTLYRGLVSLKMHKSTHCTCGGEINLYHYNGI